MEAGWVLSKSASLIEVSGEDAGDFLHSQSTQDLRLVDGQVRYGLWLDHRGRVHGDAFALRERADRWWLISLDCPAERIVDKLSSFIIADDVELRVVEGARAVVCGGLEAVACGWEAPDDRWRAEAEGFSFLDQRGRRPWWVWVGPEAMVAAVLADRLGRARDHGLPESGGDDWVLRCLENAVVRIPHDIGAEETPHEGGLEPHVAFTKGCFPGQEVVARVERLGRAGRRLVRVMGHGSTPGGEEVPVFRGDEEAGVLRSHAALPAGGWLGRALVRRKFLEDPNAKWKTAEGAEMEVLADER